MATVERIAPPLDHDPTARAVGRRRRAGLALHALAALAVLCMLPETWNSGRYTLFGDGGQGIVERVFAVGLSTLLVTAAALWVELRRRPSGSTAALLRKAFVALVGAWIWAVFLQQDLIVARPIPSMAAAVAGGLFSLGSLAAAVAPGRAPRTRRLVDLSLTSAAVALVALELGLQAASRVSTHPLVARQRVADDDQLLSAMRLVPGSPYLGGRANSRGFVDEEFGPQRTRPRRVVSIGDSFSTGVVPHAFHYTTVAERRLGDTEVLNLGAPGIGPRQYRILLESEGRPLRPDLFVVALFAGNDLEEYTRLPPPRWSDWMDRRNSMLYVTGLRLWAIGVERARSGADADEIARGLGRGLAAGLDTSELERELPHLVDPLLERASYSPERFMQLEVQRAQLLGRPSEAEYARLGQQLDDLRSAAGDVPLALVVIPDEFQVDDVLWAGVLAGAGDEPLERERFQAFVRDWGAARGVPVCDLLPDLRAVPPWSDGRPHLYHLRDTHFNARGNRAAGESVARFLEGILPSPSGVSER